MRQLYCMKRCARSAALFDGVELVVCALLLAAKPVDRDFADL